jgi:6-phosphofructokinase 1
VAEGAGQHLIPREKVEKDASGNIKHADIGVFLKDAITAHFRAKSIPVNVRYIDPSYMIRGLPADTEDSILCDGLARNAVHAAMTGRSGLIIGLVHNRMVHVPSHMITGGRKTVSLDGDLWKSVLAVTGQPATWR